MKNLRSLLLASLVCAAFVTPAFATEPVQGTAPGGGYVTLKVNKNGALIAKGNDNNDFTASFALSDTTVTNIKAAPGTAVKACVDYIDVEGITTTTAVTLAIKQGSTTLFTVDVPAGVSQRVLALPRPACGAANAALTATLSGSPTGAVQVNAVGFTVAN